MRRSTRLTIPLMLVLLCGATVVGAADPEELVELRAALETRFDLLPLSDGLLLRARTEEGPRVVEVSGSTIALDGQSVGRDELRLRLGDEVAQNVLAVAALEVAERRSLPTIEPPAPPEPPTTEIEEAMADAEEHAAEAEEVAAAAQERAERALERAQKRRRGDSEVAVAGSLTVDEDEITDDVLVFGGFLKVQGRVEGEATVIGGSATIEGEVTGDVTAIGGPIRLEDGSHVHGDVVSVGSRVYRDEGARVDGEVEQVPFRTDLSFGPWSDWTRWDSRSHDYDLDFSPWHWWSGLGWRLVKLLFIAALAWLSLLLAKGPIGRMERRVAREPWKTGLVGLLAQVLFLPLLIMLIVFLAISIIGIPLILVVLLALPVVFVIAWLGLVAVAGRVGAWAEDRFGWKLGSPFWSVLLGFGLIASLSIIGNLLNFGVAPMRFIAGMFLFCGAVVSWAAWTIGFGAAVLTRFGTAESWNRAEDAVAPLPPVPSYPEEGEEHSEAAAEEPPVDDGR